MSKPRLGAPKRVAVGLLAGSLALFGVALAPSAGATDDVTTERLAGATRYGTAAAVAADEAFASPTMAIVASGENSHLADALAASTLAGANAPAPIILTQTDTYTAEAKSALAGLKGKGVNRVSIVGGTAAITTTVENAIKADGFTVTRVAGVDRFATAAAIEAAARAANSPDPIEGSKVAFIASGFSFADALAGSPAAAHGGLPMLLTNADSLPQATKDALDAGDIGKAVILGGTVPVSDAVANELKTITGSDPIRLAGQNRFGTAAAIGDYEINTLGFGATSAIVANGITLVDALTAGPLGGLLEAPIALTASCPAETTAWLDKWSSIIAKLYIIGGTAAVDAATATCAETAAENTANDPATAGASQTAVLNGPELQSVSISDIDADFADLTIEYTYTFDTEIDDSVDAGDFHLYNANTNTEVDGTDAEAKGNSVAVTFSLAAVGVADATLAGVDAGAVTDEDGNENPPQSITINILSGTGGPGADLTDIDLSDEENAVATFTFNSSVYPEALAGYTFTLVDDEGNTYAGSAAETVPDDDEPSTKVEVTFAGLVDDPGDDVTFDDVARGYIVDLANGSRVQNVDISGGGDTGNAPDLDAIELPADNSDLADDEVLFSFDEEIDSATNAANFKLYFGLKNSSPVSGTSISETDGNEVIVVFDEEAVNDFVAGGWVLAGAASSNGNSTEDDFGVATQSSNDADGILFDFSLTKGEVLGPQLTGVEITEETDSFGDFEEWNVVFTFDKDIADGTGLGGFSVWFNDDDDVDSLTLDDCDTDNGNQVVCVDEDDDSDIANALVASVDYDSVVTEDLLNLGSGDVDFPNPPASFEASPEEA